MALALGASSCGIGTSAPGLTPAAGEPGGFYSGFGELLAAVSAAAGLPLRALVTGGSRATVDLVEVGRADVGLALTDLVLAARAGPAPFGAPVELSAIGRVYQNYLQLAVRAESRFADLPDLADRPVSLGAAGSGAARSRWPTRPPHGPRAPWTGSCGRAGSRRRRWPRSRPGVRSGCCFSATICRRSASGTAGVPTPRSPSPRGCTAPGGRVPTIGVANLLVATSALADLDAGELVRLLVERAPDLVPASAIGIQYLDRPALVDTGDVPLHPGAARAYRALYG